MGMRTDITMVDRARVILELLEGEGVCLLGVPVKLEFPQGLPSGMTLDHILRIVRAQAAA